MEAEAVAAGSKLRSKVTQAAYILVKEEETETRKWFVRVGNDRGNYLYAQWARGRVG